MNFDKELMKTEHLTSIQSTAFLIYLVKIQDKSYFGYILKQEYQNKYHLDEFIAIDMQQQNEIKYIRKLNKKVRQGFYTFETYNQYTLLSELKQLQEQVILKICQDILMALFALHQKGILGRCFNVNNILFIENQHSVLMEYGFYPDLEFQVPEMIYNQAYNEKIDIFLLGRVLFYLMVGKDLPQFNMKNLNEASTDINLAIASTKYSDGLKNLVISMLSIDVNKRIEYVQLFAKFKNNQLYSLQEQFYKQNTFKNLTKNIIEKREYDDIIKFEEPEIFEIQDTQDFANMIKDQQIKVSYNLLSDKSTIDQSQSMGSFNPPDYEDYNKFTSLNQQQIISKVSGTQKTTTIKQDTEEIKIKKTILENEQFLRVLPYLNSDLTQDLLIWNQIYFYLYRFSLMEKLIEELQSHLQCKNNYLISIAIYGMKKAELILKREYQVSLEKCQNLYYIPVEEWQKFINSVEYKKMSSKIKFDIDVNQRLLLQKDYVQLKKVLDQYKNEGLLKDLYKFIEQYLNDNSELNDFEFIKRQYRYILTNILSLFESSEDKQNTYIKLLIMMCILIKRVCDTLSIPHHFKTICKFLKTDQINSIVQIESFLKNGTAQDFIAQYEELKQCYFSG
ncbi:unnamed protein product (macronuclear) [Paramecium tetraurelia]|uniref:Protein kinase domain-containing protein n=1 Tax=Paramecium tetraurelia TaxID=5888 RepID=A0BDT0_PARTE|nr:uncharacterized protein GSPATT00027727001 [Paramecium tetraurelia]CAK56697.1 unnamed protein product [Paramecium tetraurelia]|eukprot:XP_001424095.1 hypothetical protein (macronuclear) [Paramecium tetraurelia strain d4-2]